MSFKMRSYDVSYASPSRRQSRRSSTARRKATAKQSSRTQVFNLALSAGIVGSLGVIAILLLTLLGG